MSADPRSMRVTEIYGPYDLADAPTGIQAGDLLVAIITVYGSDEAPSITGGTPWNLQDDQAEYPLHTYVFTQAAGPTNPSSYQITLEDSTEATCTILHMRGATPAGMLLVSDSWSQTSTFFGVWCPDASPGAAGGAEVRYAAGCSVFPPAPSWSGGAGYLTRQADAVFMSSWCGARTMLSSASLPEMQVDPSKSVTAWVTYTLVIQAGAIVPETPPPPAFTPGRGSALYRYTAHDFLTGEYRDDLYPQGVTYDKRISEAGAFSGTLPVPNARVAQAVRRVIPLTRSDLTTGPGRIEIRIWRDGVLAGRYWLHGARISRGRDGKVSVQLRASTLDSYFFSVRVRTTLTYSGNQIANARSLLTHAQAQPGANIDLQLQGGTGGGSRPLEVKPDSGTSYGRAVQEYAKTSDGFEYTLTEEVGPDGVTSTWVWGAPKIVSNTVHVFTESPHGGEIDQWSIDIDALRGGTDWDVRGGTPEGDATEDRTPVYSTTKTTPHRAAGWPRIDHLVDHPTQSTDVGTLNAYADYWAARAGGAVWVRSVTVILGRHSSLTMNSLGDLARQVMTNVWHERVDGGAGYDASERIIGIAVTPSEKGIGKDIVQLILESEAT